MRRHSSLFARLLALALVVATSATLAQPAQAPLLTRSSSLAPNLLLMFDDSGSMVDNFLYEDVSGGRPTDYQPLWNGYVAYDFHGVTPADGTKLTKAKCSPQVNRL